MDFITKNLRLLTYGLLMAFFSSVGQTYFIGVFRLPIATTYELTNSEFGFYYLMITLGSAIGLNRLGHIVDRTDLRKYSLVLIAAASTACLGVGLTQPFWALLLALLCVRLVGQGLLTHASMTSMSRYFDKRRGFAVALAGLGFPLGQALLPPLAVFLMTVISWQMTWIAFAIFMLIVGVPLIVWTLTGHGDRHKKWLIETHDAPINGSDAALNKRRRDVMRDARFYFLLPVLISGPFWITGVFFFATDIAAFKGFDTATYTSLYGFYALGSVAAPFVGGYLVDRFGGQRLMTLYAPLFALGLAAILTDFGTFSVILFMAFLGFGAGVSLPINNAVWAELYGTRYLGEIKSLATSLVVFSTALAPFLIGLFLDLGVSLADILWAGTLYCLLASLVLVLHQRYAAKR